MLISAAAETRPASAEADASVAAWGTTGEAPQTGSSAHTSGRAFRAPIVVTIDKAAQEMKVFVDGVERYAWLVSTGLRTYDTPIGAYAARSMNEIWYSRQWDDAPMPHAIFFTKKGHAIHGTEDTKRLGRPASHGCVRLAPENARILFALVKKIGLKNTEIVLAGELPKEEVKAATKSPKQQARPAKKSAKAVLKRGPGGRKADLARSGSKKQAQSAQQASAKQQDAKPQVATEQQSKRRRQFDPFAIGAPRHLNRRELRRLYQSGQTPPPPGY
jgi:hypothetical protein